jgi:hypothetical protein
MGNVKYPKHPNVKVRLIGLDGNGFLVMGRVHDALRRAGVPKSELDQFWHQATARD